MTEPKISDVIKTMLGLNYFEADDKLSGGLIVAVIVLALISAYGGAFGLAFILAIVWVFFASGGIRFVTPYISQSLESMRKRREEYYSPTSSSSTTSSETSQPPAENEGETKN